MPLDEILHEWCSEVQKLPDIRDGEDYHKNQLNVCASKSTPDTAILLDLIWNTDGVIIRAMKLHFIWCLLQFRSFKNLYGLNETKLPHCMAWSWPPTN